MASTLISSPYSLSYVLRSICSYFAQQEKVVLDTTIPRSQLESFQCLWSTKVAVVTALKPQPSPPESASLLQSSFAINVSCQTGQVSSVSAEGQVFSPLGFSQLCVLFRLAKFPPPPSPHGEHWPPLPVPGSVLRTHHSLSRLVYATALWIFLSIFYR